MGRLGGGGGVAYTYITTLFYAIDKKKSNQRGENMT